LIRRGRALLSRLPFALAGLLVLIVTVYTAGAVCGGFRGTVRGDHWRVRCARGASATPVSGRQQSGGEASWAGDDKDHTCSHGGIRHHTAAVLRR